MLFSGLHRYYAIEDPAENSDGGPQALQNQPDPGVLYAQGEIHPAELPR